MNTDKIYAEQLANEYAPKDTSKVVALRKLDAKAKLPATIFTYTFGIIAALIFGTGMCLAMGQIGSGTTGSFVLGIVIGIIGMIGMGVNYPIYKSCWQMGRRNTPLRSWSWPRGSANGKYAAWEADLPETALSRQMGTACCPPRCPLRHWSSSLCLSVRKIRWHMGSTVCRRIPLQYGAQQPPFFSEDSAGLFIAAGRYGD